MDVIPKRIKWLGVFALAALLLFLYLPKIGLWLREVSWHITKPESFSYLVSMGSCSWSVISNEDNEVTYRLVEGDPSCAIDDYGGSAVPDVRWLFAHAHYRCANYMEYCELHFHPEYAFPTGMVTTYETVFVNQFRPCEAAYELPKSVLFAQSRLDQRLACRNG